MLFSQLGRTALHNAAFGGNVHVVKMLLSRHRKMIMQTDNVSIHIVFKVMIAS